MNTHTITEAEAGIRLDRWCKIQEIPYHLVQKLCRKGAIKCNGKKVKADCRLQTDDVVQLPTLETREARPSTAIYLTAEETEAYLLPHIVHETTNWVLINKPRGLASQGGSGVKRAVDMLCKAHPRCKAWRLVHRLDKDTSGLLLLAKSQEEAARLTLAFRNRSIEKTYYAIAAGVPHPKQGQIIVPLAVGGDAGLGQEKTRVDEEKGKKAVTEYSLISRASDIASLLQLSPLTGRKHQIRAHLSAIDAPVLGDGKYGGSGAFLDGLPNHMHLHAYRLHFDGQTYHAPLPDDFLRSVERLGLTIESRDES